jgi:hypothetical protein
MNGKLITIIATVFILISGFASDSYSQRSSEVEAKGLGITRQDALADAMRNAIGQAVGVALTSQTRVEDFIVIQDAINTRAEGYIESYSVIREGKVGSMTEVLIKAKVSLDPLRADINLLANSLGGIRFLVMYDDRNVSAEEKEYYEHVVERINEYLSTKKYRYIERKRFEELKREALGIFQDSPTNDESYVQYLGMMANAQFIINVRKINIQSRSGGYVSTDAKVTVEVQAYDNCTAEGLGTIVMESDWMSSRVPKNATMDGLNKAVQGNLGRLLSVFTSYISSWVNNGTPFELRFYSAGTFRDFRDLRRKLVEDPNFGGQIEVVSFNNYTKLIITFRDRPDDLAYRILDYADEVNGFKDKNLDVKLIYGRQINFAPQNTFVPELQHFQGE